MWRRERVNRARMARKGALPNTGVGTYVIVGRAIDNKHSKVQRLVSTCTGSYRVVSVAGRQHVDGAEDTPTRGRRYKLSA